MSAQRLVAVAAAAVLGCPQDGGPPAAAGSDCAHASALSNQTHSPSDSLSNTKKHDREHQYNTLYFTEHNSTEVDERILTKIINTST
jgi:hypothetical protein